MQVDPITRALAASHGLRFGDCTCSPAERGGCPGGRPAIWLGIVYMHIAPGLVDVAPGRLDNLLRQLRNILADVLRRAGQPVPALPAGARVRR